MFLLGKINDSTSSFPDRLRVVSIISTAQFSLCQKLLYVRLTILVTKLVMLDHEGHQLTVLAAPAKRVMSLKDPHLKMSKSHTDDRSRILLTDSPEDIHKKIKVALTDSEVGITYDPIHRPGVSNLLEILGHFEERSCDELASEYRTASLRSLKEHLATRISKDLEPIREKYLSIMADKTGYLESVAEQGARDARCNAELTMKHVREAIGL